MKPASLKWLPNAITISRLLFIIPYAWLLLKHADKNTALGLGFLIVLSDKLDGTLARRLHAESKFGEFMDSLAVTIFVLLSWILFYWNGEFNLIVLLLLLLPRPLIGISLIAYRIQKKRWNTSHTSGNRFGGVINFIAILWLLSGLPFALHLLWGMIVLNYFAVLFSIMERFRTA